MKKKKDCRCERLHGFNDLVDYVPALTLRDRVLNIFLGYHAQEYDYDNEHEHNHNNHYTVRWAPERFQFKPIHDSKDTHRWMLDYNFWYHSKDVDHQKMAQMRKEDNIPKRKRYPHQTRWTSLVDIEKIQDRCRDFLHLELSHHKPYYLKLRFDPQTNPNFSTQRLIVNNTCPLFLKFNQCNKKICHFFHPYGRKKEWFMLLQSIGIRSNRDNGACKIVAIKFRNQSSDGQSIDNLTYEESSFLTLSPLEVAIVWRILNDKIFNCRWKNKNDAYTIPSFNLRPRPPILDINSSQCYKTAYIYFDKEIMFNKIPSGIKRRRRNKIINNINKLINQCIKELACRLTHKWFGNRIIKTHFSHSNDINLTLESPTKKFFNKMGGNERFVDQNTVFCVKLPRVPYYATEAHLRKWIDTTLAAPAVEKYEIPKEIKEGLRIDMMAIQQSNKFPILDFYLPSETHVNKFIKEFDNIVWEDVLEPLSHHQNNPERYAAIRDKMGLYQMKFCKELTKEVKLFSAFLI